MTSSTLAMPHFAGQSFYDTIRASRETGKLHWYLTRYREIRAVPAGRQVNYDNCMCPVTAVHWLLTSGRHYRPQQWAEAAHEIQMDYQVALEIANAADFAPFSNKILRSALREATGLSDVLEEC
jgi:hypothetical protein